MTSIPASRRARAMTFAPRSWPSSPGFAMSTRILFAMVVTSVEQRFLPHAEDLPHHAANLAEGRLGSDCVENERHRIRLALACLPQAVQGTGVLLRVSAVP